MSKVKKRRDYIKKNKYKTTKELMELFGVSDATISKDRKALGISVNDMEKEYIQKNKHKSPGELANALGVSQQTIFKYKREMGIGGEELRKRGIRKRREYVRANQHKGVKCLAAELNVSTTTIRQDLKDMGLIKTTPNRSTYIEIDPMPLKMIPYKLQGNYISKEDISKIKAKEGGFYKVKEAGNKNNDSYSNRGVWECVKNYKDFILFKKNGIKESFLKIDIKTNTIKLEVLR